MNNCGLVLVLVHVLVLVLVHVAVLAARTAALGERRFEKSIAGAALRVNEDEHGYVHVHVYEHEDEDVHARLRRGDRGAEMRGVVTGIHARASDGGPRKPRDASGWGRSIARAHGAGCASGEAC